METDLRDVPTPEIWETEEDKKLEIKQLKEKYTKYELSSKNSLIDTLLIILARLARKKNKKPR